MEEGPVRLEILARPNRLGILGESFEGVVVANAVVLQNAAFGKGRLPGATCKACAPSPAGRID